MPVILGNIRKYDELTEDERKFAISRNKDLILSEFDLKETHPDLSCEDVDEFIDNIFRSGFYTFDENLLLR